MAVNGSPADGDRLVSVTSDIGTVALTGQTKIAPRRNAGGRHARRLQPSALDATEGAASAKAAVALSKPISNGLTYDFTFTFEKAGDQAVEVPISAGEAPRREAENAAEPNAETEGHH